jgi:chemotaxis signal transduction protein
MEPIKKTKKSSHKRQFCSFRVGGRLFGVNILDVKEVNTETGFTPIFHAPEEVRGYVNIRGQIHLILDLRMVMGFETRPVDEESRLVLFKPCVGDALGILVDRIGDVVTVDKIQIEDRRQADKGSPEGKDRRASDVGAGVCKLDNEIMVILNPRSLAKCVENP